MTRRRLLQLVGLAAALDLVEGGHEVTILEAKMRSSGRVLTLREPFARARNALLLATAIATGVGFVQPATLRAQAPLSIPAPPGGPIAADVYGSGERAVVLVHGGRFDRGSWKAQAKQLAAGGFRVVAIDLRAAVESRAGRETPCLYDETCLAQDLLATVRYLHRTGAKKVAVIGASLGGGAAAQATVEAKPGEIDRVVLLAPMAIAAPEKIQGRKLYLVARDDLGSGGAPRLIEIRKQYVRARQPKELVLLQGSAHAQFLFETPERARVMREILRFLTAP